MGSACSILQTQKDPDGKMRVLAHGIGKIRINDIQMDDDAPIASVEEINETWETSDELEALMRRVSELSQTVIRHAPMIPDEMQAVVVSMQDPHRLAYMAVTMTRTPAKEQQQILETESATEKLRMALKSLTHEAQVIELGGEIQETIKQQMDKSQREYMLRQQLKAIQQELGESDPHAADTTELRERFEKLNLPEHVIPVVEKALSRLDRISPTSPEYPLARDYLDWLFDYPWNKRSEDTLDLDEAQRILR